MDGVIIINKPKDYTSHDIVNIVKKTLNTSKAGHTGTLDPKATGVLPILVGKATRISKYLIEHNKTYIAELALGEKRSTGDIEGEITEIKCVPIFTQEQIKEVLNSFLGKQKQIPPIYSSIKVNGKKAYEYARKGQAIDIPAREIEIKSINLISFEDNTIIFKVECSKGTYIRTLCQDVAEKLGTVGFMKNLCRTKVDEFSIDNAINLEQLKKCNLPIINIEQIFEKKPSIKLDERKTKLFLNGVKLTYKMDDGIYRIYSSNTFIGIGIIYDNLLKRDVIVIDN